MRSQTLPHGKFYKVLPKTVNSQQNATTDASLPKAARGHMVMVLGWADRWNWVKVVCITSSAASTLPYIDYLPIYPSKKNQHSGLQLQLCNGWDAWTITGKKSYVKMDGVYEIPIERLTAASGNGRQYELQSKSWDKVQNFLGKRNERANNDGQVAPDFVSNPNREGRPTQDLGAGIASDAWE